MKFKVTFSHFERLSQSIIIEAADEEEAELIAEELDGDEPGWEKWTDDGAEMIGVGDATEIEQVLEGGEVSPHLPRDDDAAGAAV
jgi:hypothetical protein